MSDAGGCEQKWILQKTDQGRTGKLSTFISKSFTIWAAHKIILLIGVYKNMRVHLPVICDNSENVRPVDFQHKFRTDKRLQALLTKVKKGIHLLKKELPILAILPCSCAMCLTSTSADFLDLLYYKKILSAQRWLNMQTGDLFVISWILLCRLMLSLSFHSPLIWGRYVGHSCTHYLFVLRELDFTGYSVYPCIKNRLSWTFEYRLLPPGQIFYRKNFWSRASAFARNSLCTE